MASEIVLSIDLGTTGIKAAAFDERLACLGSAYVENRLHYPAPGLVEQDPAYMLAAALDLTRQVVNQLGEAAGRVVAICCSGQMAAIMGVDARWNAVGHYDAILDPRSNVCQPLIAPHAETIQRHSGGLTTQLEKMLYWRDYLPEIYSRVDKFVGINGFVAGKLAGLDSEAAFTDQTFGMVNGLMDAVSGEWDGGLLSTFNVQREKLPRILAPHDVVGTLDPALARNLGLPAGVQILAGAGDGAATYAGSGMSRPGQALELSGTACAFGVYSDNFLPDVEQQLFLNLKSPTTPGWYVIYVNQFGRTHRWFIDTFCQDLIEAGDVHAAYNALDEQAAALPPGAGGVFASPHLGGRASPPKPYYRGAWLGFGLGFTRAHFYRSLLEAHAAEFREAQSRLRDLGASAELREVIVSGGGSRSHFWTQLKADILGSKYKRLVDSDLSTLRGDAMIAARARHWPILEGEQAFLQFDAEYEPNREAAEQYAKVLANYRTFTSGLEGVMANLFS